MTSPLTRTAPEHAQTERFEASYVRGQSPVLRDIERKVCGCDYGGTSWTVRAEADAMADPLGLKPGLRLLEIGSGNMRLRADS